MLTEVRFFMLTRRGDMETLFPVLKPMLNPARVILVNVPFFMLLIVHGTLSTSAAARELDELK